MSRAIENLLVGTDFSEAAGLALARASLLGREHQLPLHLVHAIADGDWLARMARVSHGQFNEELLRKSAGSRLARLLDQCRGLGLSQVSSEVLDGPLHRHLHELAEDHPGSLFVMGARGEGGVREALLGSTADRVLRTGVLPVLLCRREPTPWRRVVLATDFSSASSLAAALGLALAPAASHFLLHACELEFDRGLAFANAGKESREAYHREAWEQANRQLAAFASALGPAAASVTRAPREGSPSRVLAGFVQEAQVDLVVLGSRPRARWEANLLGSTALFATNQLPCDVLLVPGFAEG